MRNANDIIEGIRACSESLCRVGECPALVPLADGVDTPHARAALILAEARNCPYRLMFGMLLTAVAKGGDLSATCGFGPSEGGQNASGITQNSL